MDLGEGPWTLGGRIAGHRAGDAAEIEAGTDLLILGEGVTLDDAAVAELRRVAASDPMIAFVSPRFGDPGRLAALARALPPVTYAPLPDPRGLYVKASVLTTLGLTGAVTDWDGTALAANACGFRCALANRAGVSAPPRPDEGDERARAARLEAAFPGTRAAIGAHLSAAPREAERRLAGLAPDGAGRIAVAFDATHLGPRHSGTAELARHLVAAATHAWAARFEVAVVADEAAYAFHFAGLPRPPRRVGPFEDETFGACIRIGQPFGWKEVDHAVRRAPVWIVFMLDTIGLDCIRAAPDDLDALWRFTLGEADGLLFNSAFTQAQFERRFTLPAGTPTLVSLHPTETAPLSEPGAARDGPVLIVGNDLSHKRVAETARLLTTRCANLKLIALGLMPGTVEGVAGLPSGGLDAETLAELYRNARAVVYPTVYEGFGLPILEALRHRRPVLVRRLPPFAEIAADIGERSTMGECANIHWFDTDDDLVRLLEGDLGWQPRADPAPGGAAPGSAAPESAAPGGAAPGGAAPARTWSTCARDLERVLDAAIARADYGRVLRRVDFMRGRLAFARGKRFQAAGPADDAERLAAAAGRLAQGTMLRLAATWPGRGLVRLAARRRGGPRGWGR